MHQCDRLGCRQGPILNACRSLLGRFRLLAFLGDRRVCPSKHCFELAFGVVLEERRISVKPPAQVGVQRMATSTYEIVTLRTLHADA